MLRFFAAPRPRQQARDPRLALNPDPHLGDGFYYRRKSLLLAIPRRKPYPTDIGCFRDEASTESNVKNHEPPTS